MPNLHHQQVALYLTALTLGAAASFAPGVATLAGHISLPALSLLLLATFLSIPLTPGRPTNSKAPGFRRTLLALNFLLVPLVVAALIAALHLLAPTTPDALLFTAALVLLAPCIDYVVVFTRLSGGNESRLLAATPLLLGAQILLLPLWLWAYQILGLWASNPITFPKIQDAGSGITAALAAIALPFLLALALQKNARTRTRAQRAADTTMTPLMLLVLSTTTAAHTATVAHQLTHLLPLMGLYAAYALTTWLIAHQLTKTSPRPDRIALTFSAVTRNALVILPIVLAAASIQEGNLNHLLPLAVITQTMIELLTMTAMVAHYRRQGS